MQGCGLIALIVFFLTNPQLAEHIWASSQPHTPQMQPAGCGWQHPWAGPWLHMEGRTTDLTHLAQVTPLQVHVFGPTGVACKCMSVIISYYNMLTSGFSGGGLQSRLLLGKDMHCGLPLEKERVDMFYQPGAGSITNITTTHIPADDVIDDQSICMSKKGGLCVSIS